MGLENISVRGLSSDVHCIMFDFENIICGVKEQCFQKQISDCGGDQKKLFAIVNSLLGLTSVSSLRLTIFIMSSRFSEQDLPMPSSINFNLILDLNLVSSLTYFKIAIVDY